MPKVNSDQIRDGSILTQHLSQEVVDSLGIVLDGSITTVSLVDGAITSVKISDGSVTQPKILDGAVSQSKLLDAAVTQSKIQSGAVTLDKLATEVTDVLNAGISSGSITLAMLASAVADALVPTGSIQMWGITTPPPAWLLLDGAAHSRTTQAALFAHYGTTWGVGDGSTTFNVPNFVDFMPLGAGTIAALAASGGAASVALSLAELAAHTHNGSSHTHTGPNHTHTGPNHSHSVSSDGSHTHSSTGSFSEISTPGGVPTVQIVQWSGSTSTSSNGSHDHGGGTGSAGTGATGSAGTGDTGSGGTGATSSAGSGTAHNNMPPHKGVNFIVKT